MMTRAPVVLFLGASPTQLAPIRYAKQRGYRVVTCDNRPENPGHTLADASISLSTTDLEGVLKECRSLGVDGIVAYASDVAAPTAAYVSQELGLAGNPYESVRILTEKDLFRSFLREHGFRAPDSASFTQFAEAEAVEWFQNLSCAAFVKPVDSSGSKGVSRCENIADFAKAFRYALAYSRSGRVIVEREILRDGPQVAGDGFLLEGQLVYRAWGNENFNQRCNGLVPVAQTFPTTHSVDRLQTAETEFQVLLNLLGMRSGALNFDFLFDIDGQVTILELGPRNGGCRIPEVVNHWDGVDMIAATVEAALGNAVNLGQTHPRDAFWSTYVIHSVHPGRFKELTISGDIARCIVDLDLWVSAGDAVQPFWGSDAALGSALLRFETQGEMTEKVQRLSDLIRVDVESG